MAKRESAGAALANVRWANATQEEKSEAARNAARARWGKPRPGGAKKRAAGGRKR
jgi:hypothetical protein